MTEEQHCQSTDFRSAGRRDPVRKGVKTTYIAPAVLAAVETDGPAGGHAFYRELAALVPNPTTG